MAKKLTIKVDNGERPESIVVRISDKSNALLEDIAKRTKRSKSYVANKFIEFAYEYVEISEEE